jgi:hypothetical protein
MSFKIDLARKIAGGVALAGLGLLMFDLTPAAARPPDWAPARGYRRRHDNGNHRYNRYNRYNRNNRYRYNRYRYNPYGTYGTYGRYGRPGDLDGDGIPNPRDRDRDGDGVPDRRDDHPADRRRH